MLSRYFAMQGHGFQAACPEEVFRVLHRALSVSFECFASPLNCYYGAFCSAFSDVDVQFGSSGSFWKWNPPLEGGSFQANPPFVAIIMKKMAEKILLLLNEGEQEASQRPLSFVVVVPGWLEDEGYAAMASSRHKRAHWIVAQQDHGFCDGAQHQRRDRYRSSPYDTAIFVLQNATGALKFSIDGNKSSDQTSDQSSVNLETQLRRAFATGVPTESAVARRKRDGRGFADEDGGGGVYKGKKRNKTGDGVQKRRKQESKYHKKKKKKRRRGKKE
jgi:phosphorylated CTD-interacting factor 1